MPVILHGPGYSTYSRTARLALEEKGVAYELNEVDILSGKGHAPEHLARQPWGKVPAFEHDGFHLFETFAITRYVDEAFPGPALQPADAKGRARMTQICGIVDSYAYGAMVGKVFWQEIIVPMQGGTPDAKVAEEGLAATRKALGVIEGLMAGDLLCGGGVTLADLHLLPAVEYLRMARAGASAFAASPKLSAWWDRMNARDSVVKTRPKLG
ncbi:glutathione S-transferase family protein [Falsiroseomonas sp. CW058]|uniref:glutathione S-transferase family protein n=1 Tax=Falsiroseomonas sp. CW058 TaxID=3388664 RepID=UPI003D314D1A